jgi:hypothetical protein
LANIPDEFKPVAAMLIGAFLLVFVVLPHGDGLDGILVSHKRRIRRLRAEPPRLVRAVVLFGGTVFLTLGLHIAGFAIWAYSLLFLGLIPRASNAVYF